jgi:uncharacterized protein (DUF362 family)
MYMSKISRQPGCISRRDFLKKAGVVGSSALLAACIPQLAGCCVGQAKPVVSIVENDDIPTAVEEAIDLLGGIETILSGKQKIMLKPNLVTDNPRCTTNPQVVQTLAALMQEHGKTVSIGEGSAAVYGYNVNLDGTTCFMDDPARLDAMQQSVFDRLGYTRLADSLGVPLVNLHTGEMVDVDVPGGGLAYEQLTLHRSLTEIDLLCSVPMMKTHERALVSLGMKNLIGLYPGSVYGTVRSSVHDHATLAGSPGIAYETIDMVRANKLGLVVIDGSMAMEGNGPCGGTLVQMNLIIAGTNPLATDMVAASVMGFRPDEIPTFVCANSAGLQPQSLGEIEVRGKSVQDVQRDFERPTLNPWTIGEYEECAL